MRVAPMSLVVAGVLLVPGCSTTSKILGDLMEDRALGDAKPSVKPDKDRKSAPDFELKDANGHTVRLSDYRGKVVLLDFWATWCGPCKVEIPWFQEFERQNKDKGFAVLGVAMDEDGWDVVKPFAQYMKINYRLVIGNESIAEKFGGVDALPTTFLIDREGKIAAVHVGLSGKRDFEDGIRELL